MREGGWVGSSANGNYDRYHPNEGCRAVKTMTSPRWLSAEQVDRLGLSRCSDCDGIDRTDHPDGTYDPSKTRDVLLDASEDPETAVVSPDRVLRPSPMFGELEGGDA